MSEAARLGRVTRGANDRKAVLQRNTEGFPEWLLRADQPLGAGSSKRSYDGEAASECSCQANPGGSRR